MKLDELSMLNFTRTWQEVRN